MPPRRGEIWATTGGPTSPRVLVISSTVYNEIADEPTVLITLIAQNATAEGFCVPLGEDQWAVLGLVTFVAKASLDIRERQVDVQTLTNVNNMLFKILATPDR
ncbi:MazF family transcriptional regulator [Pseudofrankia inefficax]|uniref:Transcriptional modulator of MazE/toxin, MazF n=1 Tax=Pseudofrankia inefficax (strain DSM 45817 / CECT 9037 / DDB 130130 / EuI1c) TaxID=298654 RepID=E3J8W0_PSEI1|nr:MazF family transcriptional regulator [Pseudofrankia inefficax]ADP79693.1 hypothetical protein FraEuI1c_1635 [Pseudofrankia inefficax]